jgi:hypothetical protein
MAGKKTIGGLLIFNFKKDEASGGELQMTGIHGIGAIWKAGL